MELLSSLNSLFRSIFSFIPRLAIVKETDRGVKFIRGKKAKVMNPGVHGYWPLLTEIDSVNVKRQVLKLPVQTLYSKDERTVVAGGVVVYTIEDVYRYLVDNYDAQESIDEVAAACLRDIVTSNTVDEIQNSRNGTDFALTKEVSQSLEEFGVRTEYVRFTHFAPARVINIVGGSSDKPTYVDDYYDEEEY